ncbi:Mo-dependent nitrogenase family protein [Stanieria cyanosphaera PCC 7437]|uniref:Mo-dependent nitrogenase family protein n=1 Tax=Stanieria cyanosphaera (strain ATCC 29371 / PCC 7437) TaxID=111780 RepID=K9XXR2_STAC7|nr:Mo-dependent nitrogenase C-terminal domain-containing protein [Stanieria cyanosphaera]AFZ37390.1 Mo-dependent nitrogenase family protein [Stanieria cyanosphaera PCC 7437]
MTSTTQSIYTDSQIVAWLRGLYTIAWSDGHYDPEEEELIAQLTRELANLDSFERLEPIKPEELAIALGKDPETAENFLRTAVLVAVADGVYSAPEYELLQQFSQALNLEIEALKSLENTLYRPEESTSERIAKQTQPRLDVLHPVKDWLDGMEVQDPRLARFVCKVIPSQCPFERDINLFGRTIAHIPPLCKLNPLYEQLVSLRFRSLSYLADDCGEDISEYI